MRKKNQEKLGKGWGEGGVDKKLELTTEHSPCVMPHCDTAEHVQETPARVKKQTARVLP